MRVCCIPCITRWSMRHPTRQPCDAEASNKAATRWSMRHRTRQPAHCYTHDAHPRCWPSPPGLLGDVMDCYRGFFCRDDGDVVPVPFVLCFAANRHCVLVKASNDSEGSQGGRWFAVNPRLGHLVSPPPPPAVCDASRYRYGTGSFIPTGVDSTD